MDATPVDDRRLFDRLCLLRELYARRGDRDRVSVLTLEEAMAYGASLLARSAASTV